MSAQTSAVPGRSDVDCEAGRRMGCGTYCCRLVVRLEPDEPEAGDGTAAAKRCVDKDENGDCVHFDAATCRCRIWERRPRVCRGYDCNKDFLLQVVIREGFTSIVKLVKRSAQAYIPKETYRHVPYLGED